MAFAQLTHRESLRDIKTCAGLGEVREELEKCRDFTPALVHRDCYEKQVLIDGEGATLIDFDTLCLSDPALDVGNFLAHLHLLRLQGLTDAAGLE